MARLEALRLPRRRARTPRGWQRLRWALLGVATVIVTIVASMPAAWMADRVAAETQRRVLLADAAGIHPVSLGPLPDAIAKLLAIQVNVQKLAVEAAMRASKEIALQALLIDPVVNSATAAVKLLDELWDVNRPYIRPCL